jgi:hypothetical protein
MHSNRIIFLARDIFLLRACNKMQRIDATYQQIVSNLLRVESIFPIARAQ